MPVVNVIGILIALKMCSFTLLKDGKNKQFKFTLVSVQGVTYEGGGAINSDH